jgi:hypothetical protein
VPHILNPTLQPCLHRLRRISATHPNRWVSEAYFIWDSLDDLLCIPVCAFCSIQILIMPFNERLVEPGKVAEQAGLPQPTAVNPYKQAIFMTSILPKVTPAPHIDLMKRDQEGALIGWAANGTGC